MANSKARTGRKSVVSIGGVAGTTPNYTPIEEISKASFSGSSWNILDASNFDSDIDEEKIKGMRNNGQITFEGNYNEASPGQILLENAYNDVNGYNFKVQLTPANGQTEGRVFIFTGLVSSFDIPIETKGIVTFSSKIEITGPLTVTPGS